MGQARKPPEKSARSKVCSMQKKICPLMVMLPCKQDRACLWACSHATDLSLAIIEVQPELATTQ
eukprot:1162131-Pelagomonas_calceolata.AAC.10